MTTLITPPPTVATVPVIVPVAVRTRFTTLTFVIVAVAVYVMPFTTVTIGTIRPLLVYP